MQKRRQACQTAVKNIYNLTKVRVHLGYSKEFIRSKKVSVVAGKEREAGTLELFIEDNRRTS